MSTMTREERIKEQKREYTEFMIKNNEAVERLFKAGARVYYGNNINEDSNVTAIVEMVSPDRGWGAYIPSTYCCVNTLYAKEDENAIKISESSCGGDLISGQSRELTKEVIDRYNRDCGIRTARIKRVVFRDGTEWTFDLEDEAVAI